MLGYVMLVLCPNLHPIHLLFENFENVQISVSSDYFEILKICVNFQISGIF
jgi:hypothetical protein